MLHLPQPLGDDWFSWDPADLHNYPFGQRRRTPRCSAVSANVRKSQNSNDSPEILSLIIACQD
jgi:hypothetical protein